MRKICLFLACIALLIIDGYSQLQRVGKITLTVQTAQPTPLENATVQLLRAKDSGLVKAAISDKACLLYTSPSPRDRG